MVDLVRHRLDVLRDPLLVLRIDCCTRPATPGQPARCWAFLAGGDVLRLEHRAPWAQPLATRRSSIYVTAHGLRGRGVALRSFARACQRTPDNRSPRGDDSQELDYGASAPLLWHVRILGAGTLRGCFARRPHDARRGTTRGLRESTSTTRKQLCRMRW